MTNSPLKGRRQIGKPVIRLAWKRIDTSSYGQYYDLMCWLVIGYLSGLLSRLSLSAGGLEWMGGWFDGWVSGCLGG